MITGCNTNVLYRGKQFHVQTEDSGRGKPHIISHVYHGGTIIASEKSSYSHRIGTEELDIKVRAQIELQHKTMLKRLMGGEFDAVIDERLGGGAAAAKPAPARISAESVAESTGSGGSTSGSITAGADTNPSVDVERPAAATKPNLEKPASRAFGDSIDSEKPLDEVILEYLVDKARDRAAEKKQPTARRQRQKG
jgi:hypothetical protein